MRIAVAGAAGFLGRSVVRSMSHAGHEVIGLVRSPQRSPQVVSDGGTPKIGDLLAPDSLSDALAGCDVVVHLAQPSEGSIAERVAVRVDGGRNLAEAAVRAKVRRFIVGSGYWVYANAAGTIDESSPLDPRSISQVNFDAEQAVRTVASGGDLEVIVARPGMVYGDGSWFGEMVRELQDGSYRYIADGSNALSPIHLADAGRGFLTLAERGERDRTYLVVDDRPVSTRQFAEFVAQRLGAPPPTSVPFAAAADVWGRDLALLNAANRRASNARLRALGWAPEFPSYLEGIPAALAHLQGPTRSARAP